MSRIVGIAREGFDSLCDVGLEFVLRHLRKRGRIQRFNERDGAVLRRNDVSQRRSPSSANMPYQTREIVASLTRQLLRISESLNISAKEVNSDRDEWRERRTEGWTRDAQDWP